MDILVLHHVVMDDSKRRMVIWFWSINYARHNIYTSHTAYIGDGYEIGFVTKDSQTRVR